MKRTLLTLTAVVFCSALCRPAAAQRTTRPQDLLNRSDVRKELGVGDEQIEEFSKIRREQMSEVQKSFRGLRELSREDRAKKYREVVGKASKTVKDALGKILLPHQTDRLEEITLQYRLRSGTARVLQSDDVVGELKISDKQKDKIRKASEEAAKEMAEEMAKLREKMKQKILEELTPAQRTQWKAMIGKPFEFQNTRRTRQRPQQQQ